MKPEPHRQDRMDGGNEVRGVDQSGQTVLVENCRITQIWQGLNPLITSKQRLAAPLRPSEVLIGQGWEQAHRPQKKICLREGNQRFIRQNVTNSWPLDRSPPPAPGCAGPLFHRMRAYHVLGRPEKNPQRQPGGRLRR